jgi:hypothetical protein
MFGNDPLNDPSVDPTVIGSLSNASVTPSLMVLSKNANAHESESVTGPNSPVNYTISIDIPNGQTISNLKLIDKLPKNLQFVSLVSASPGGYSILQQPATSTPNNAPNNQLIVQWPSITGTAGSGEASMTLRVFAPLLDADGNPVISTVTGASAPAINDARAEGSWTPIDPRDPTTPVVSDATPNDNTITLKSVAVQKSHSLAIDTTPTGLSPYDTIQYALNFQISDFLAFKNFLLSDKLSDGQRIDNTFTPTLQVWGSSSSTNGETCLQPTTQRRSIAQEMDLRTFPFLFQTNSSAGVWTEISLVDARHPVHQQQIAQSQILDSRMEQLPTVPLYKIRTQTHFLQEMQPSMRVTPLSNSVTSTGDVINHQTLAQTGSSASDTSGSSLQIQKGGLTQKSIYAINGNTLLPSPLRMSPGDVITYRLKINSPLSRLDNFKVTDYLPLPIFSATSVTAFNPTVDASIPAAGTAKFGPEDTLTSVSGRTPTISSSITDNSLIFDYGTGVNSIPTSTTIDLLFSLTVNSKPFADKLLLTNVGQSQTGDTFNQTATQSQIVQIQLGEPDVRITKGVVASTQPLAIFSPSSVAPVTFTTATGTCPTFSGTIASSSIASTPVHSSVSELDNGARSIFAILLENQGTSPNGAFNVNVKDSMPAGMTLPTDGLNLCVTDGNGTALPYTDLGGGLMGSGISLNDVSIVKCIFNILRKKHCRHHLSASVNGAPRTKRVDNQLGHVNQL